MSGQPLANRVALVTGASRGIGRAIALSLAGAGADLVVTSTTLDGARKTAGELEALGRRALAFGGDVSDPKEADRLYREVSEKFGHIDLLVNNAGIVVRRPFLEMTDEDFTRVVDVNLNGAFLITRRFLPGMVQRRQGRVVNVSSISSTIGSPRSSGYAASKWGLNGLTKSLAEELKSSGVMICSVLPGSVDTDMLKGSGFSPDMSAEEVAKVVRFLCTEAPLAMTGSLVEVFG